MNNDNQTPSWNKELVTGIAQIDEQHQILIDMLDQANQRLTANPSPGLLADLIHDLMSYALYHFEDEESLMQNNHYDPQKQAMHVKEHREFAAKIATFQQALKLGNLISAEELLRFLHDWLQKHIQNTDKQLGQFLSTKFDQLS